MVKKDKNAGPAVRRLGGQNAGRFANWTPPEFDANGMTKWHWKCQHHENLVLGRGVDIGSFTYINAKKGVEIGDGAQLGSHCSVYSISTIDGKEGAVRIGRNARIGSHSIIMPGVTIGENAIVGALSFVNVDVPPNVMVFGIPVKVIKRLE